MKKCYLSFFLIIVMCISCARKKIGSDNPKEADVKSYKVNQTTESFLDFYDRFHRDSLYQLSRLNIPLRGKRVDFDTTYSWDKSNWELIRFKIRDIDTSEYKIKITENEKLVIEEIKYPYESGFYFESKYQLIDGKWYLVECNDYNL